MYTTQLFLSLFNSIRVSLVTGSISLLASNLQKGCIIICMSQDPFQNNDGNYPCLYNISKLLKWIFCIFPKQMYGHPKYFPNIIYCQKKKCSSQLKMIVKIRTDSTIINNSLDRYHKVIGHSNCCKTSEGQGYMCYLYSKLQEVICPMR